MGTILVNNWNKRRQNLVKYSEDFTNSFWFKGSGNTGFNGTGMPPVLTPNAGLSPVGTNTATSIKLELTSGFTSTTNRSGFSQNFPATVGVNYTASLFIKPLNTTNIEQIISQDAIGTSASGGVVINRQSTPIGNGWYRIFRTSTTQITAGSIRVQLIGGNSTSGSVPPILEFLLWGVQINEGNRPFTYTKTEGTIFNP